MPHPTVATIPASESFARLFDKAARLPELDAPCTHGLIGVGAFVLWTGTTFHLTEPVVLQAQDNGPEMCAMSSLLERGIVPSPAILDAYATMVEDALMWDESPLPIAWDISLPNRDDPRSLWVLRDGMAVVGDVFIGGQDTIADLLQRSLVLCAPSQSAHGAINAHARAKGVHGLVEGWLHHLGLG